MLSSLAQEVKRAVATHGLASPGDHLLLAVSGGADSMAMLVALQELAPGLKLRLSVAHLNHRIRGAAADADAAFVEAICRKQRVACVVGRSDVPRLARRKGLSLEMAAREARYRFLARTARRAGADAVATAHTADDQAETVLLKLARGAGPGGLGGIRPDGRIQASGVRHQVSGSRRSAAAGVRVIRPVLGVTRAEVEAFLKERGETWREDATNRDTAYLRNRVRHEVLPVLTARLNPKIREALCRTAEVMREEDAWLDEIARLVLAGCVAEDGTLPVEELQGMRPAPRRRLLRLWLASGGFPTEQIDLDVVVRLEALVERGKGTRQIDVAGGWIVRRRYGRVVLECVPSSAAPTPAFRRTVPVPGELRVAELGLRVVTAVAPGIVKPRGTKPGALPTRASLSRAAIGRKRLYVRSWRPGDRMQPHGMRGSRKLQDIFTDAKVPVEQRGRIPVFECGGEIVWLPGYRVARGWTVKPAERAAVQVQLG